MSEKFCRMFADMSGKMFLGMSGKIFLVTSPPGKNINVKLACSGKLYCAPPKQDGAHTPMAIKLTWDINHIIDQSRTQSNACAQVRKALAR